VQPMLRVPRGPESLNAPLATHRGTAGMSDPNDSYLTPRSIADRLKLAKTDAVLAWIHSGQLAATNIGTDPTGRPTWRIAPGDLAAFLEGRRAVPRDKPARRSRRKQLPEPTSYF
jgi:hypothetical protein